MQANKQATAQQSTVTIKNIPGDILDRSLMEFMVCCFTTYCMVDRITLLQAKKRDATTEREGNNQLLKVVCSDDPHKAETTPLWKHLTGETLTNLSPKRVDNERVLSEILDICKNVLEERGQIDEKVLSKKLDSIKEAIKKLKKRGIRLLASGISCMIISHQMTIITKCAGIQC